MTVVADLRSVLGIGMKTSLYRRYCLSGLLRPLPVSRLSGRA